jgi:SAM-dependent methyltransferase
MLGFAVDARDASAAMATEARKMTGVHVKVESVLDLCEVSRFDGVWASALLVHFADPEFGEAVVRMTNALKPDGVLYLSVKQGTGEAWVGGRWFRYWTPTVLTDRLSHGHGLHVREVWSAADSTRAGTEWINVLATRVAAQ